MANKWIKTKVLQTDGWLGSHIPETKRLTMDNLYDMLRKYGMVYVKPTFGSLGRGVMKTDRKVSTRRGRERVRYSYQLKETKRTFPDYESFYSSLMRHTDGASYLAQKGVRMLKHKGRVFDVRLVVQRAPQGGWEATGSVGRVAHPRKIVTNGSQGGTIYPTTYLLKNFVSPARTYRLMERMDELGLRTVKRLKRTYPGLVEIGLDLAIDRNMKPWILEVNTTPDPCPFAVLSDKSMLRRIIRYGKAYGKTYRLNCMKARRGL
ncbi:YheC/YheD family protein [Paenibacillus sp. IB182493]|uniref:YheC/YheD family protein n=1 Tax=Paenibacillus arenilitoris TaxID=2772299 RepID=A0A927H778_9BACL|nr:YheC/YheD family protein [Paenibacillus arenilitoris]